MAPRWVVFATCILHASFAHGASGTKGFAVNRFEPAERGSEWFASESLDLRGDGLPAFGVVFDWAYRPLDVPGVPALLDQVTLHAGGAVVFRDRIRFAADLPLVLFQDGLVSRSTVGDVRLSSDVRVAGEYGAPFSLALGAQLHAPTGHPALFASDGTVRVTPHALVAGQIEGFPYAAKLGFAVRPANENQVVFSVAVGVKANDRFVLGPELYGSTVATGDAFGKRQTPLELLLGGHLVLAQDWHAGLAIGPGLTAGDGSPTMRVVASFEYAPDVCVDRDGDGICAYEDACPDAPGVRTRVRKTNGCPPRDASPIPAPPSYVDLLFFDEGSVVLDEPALDRILAALRTHPEMRVRVEGHTDEREDRSLGMARADAVVRWLVAEGIDEGRVHAEGYGADRTTDRTGTEEGRRKNRRIEIHVIERTPAGR